MRAKHVVYCGGAKPSGKLGASDRELMLWGPAANMELDSASLERALARAIPPRLQDLLEIAAYIYVADQAFDRGSETGEDLGAKWRRDLRFVVGVRDPVFWATANVRGLLAETIEFVSNDTVTFDFVEVVGAPAPEPHLPLTAGPADWFGQAAVLAFSGGLDSLGGAVEQIFGGQRHVALVTHRAATKLDPVQRGLAGALRAEVSKRGVGQSVHHFPVWVRKTAAFDREPTQRTRSFLFAALGGVVARMANVAELLFFENGVVSLNLPVCGQVLGARATRTTHPKTLVLFERLLSTVFEAPFRVSNPFLWKTKADVVNVLTQHGCAPLIGASVSCSHTIEMKEAARHCGACSQCIDRRFGVLAAGAEANDPEPGYRAPLFTAARETVEEQTMLETYVLRARELGAMDARTFFGRFGEVNRVLRDLGGSADKNAQEIFSLYKRHAEEVSRVLADAVARHREEVVRGSVPPKSLLAMVLPQQGAAPAGPTAAGPRAGRRAAISHTGRFVRILHLSDPHFSDQAWDQDLVLSALANDVRAQREARGAPDLVILTGDVATSGKATEYDAAEKWLRERLLPAAAAATDRLVLVPGNHDVDRSKVTITGKALHNALLEKRDQNEIAAALADPASRAPLLGSHAAWLAFAKRLGAPDADVPWTCRRFRIGDTSVRVAALCSSWCAYSNGDHGRLIVGRYQVIQALGTEPADLTIAAIHHPWDMVAEFDAGVVRESIMRSCDVILRGHLHTTAAAKISRPDTETLEIAAGASYAGSSYPNAYQWIELDLDGRTARVYMRVWDGYDWIADRNAYGGKAKDGYAEFRLQAPPKKAGPKPATSRPRTTSKRGRRA